MTSACSSDLPPVLDGIEGGPNRDSASADVAVVDSAVDSGSDAPPPCDFDDAGCNLLMNCGPVVTFTLVGGGTPPKGGAIADGTYVLTKWEGMEPPIQPQWYRATVRLTTVPPDADASADAGPIQLWEEVTENSASRVSNSNGHADLFAISPTVLTVRYTCPNTAYVGWDYTATATELQLYDNDENVQTFTKQ